MATAPRTREQALATALAQVTNTPRTCAMNVRGWFGLAPLGDYDGDGAADAEDMWKAAKRKGSSKTPPLGCPVYWGGGSQDNGHIAIYVGGGRIRSTDAGGPGRMGTVDLDWPTRNWGMPYLGWSTDLYGYDLVSEESLRLTKWQTRLRAKRQRTTAKLQMIRKKLASRR